jgi:hypothetical protein
LIFPEVRKPGDERNIEAIKPVIAITIRMRGTTIEFEGLVSRM